MEKREVPDDSKRANAVTAEAGQYAMLNGVLYHFYQPRSKGVPVEQRTVKQVALPQVLRSDVLKSFHDCHAGGGHLGITKTHAAIREKYYFPGMYQVIHDYVTTCDQCQRMKTIRRKLPPPLTSMPISDVFDRWHMDILGPLPKTEDGYQYVLLVVDSFS
ncbi:MAG: integrase zinc binding domain-containing protein, partial [Sedimenticola sp.]